MGFLPSVPYLTLPHNAAFSTLMFLEMQQLNFGLLRYAYIVVLQPYQFTMNVVFSGSSNSITPIGYTLKTTKGPTTWNEAYSQKASSESYRGVHYFPHKIPALGSSLYVTLFFS